MISKIKSIRSLSLLGKKDIFLLLKAIVSSVYMECSLRYSAATSFYTITAFMAVGFLTLKRPCGIRSALGRDLCVLTAQQDPPRAVFACRNPPRTAKSSSCCGLPLWAAPKQSKCLHQTFMFWIYLLGIRTKQSIF